ncbi:MAG TPA: bifunctional methylenetetrahydrofolate dehydrogenase/methenyltetrahydrofolate cyclohydrolase FolD [Thermoleophilaceae bacterium]|jgi:methylenetetrahydrofolate dehydrogenase (NADP+)/methenyltetrahydrofolate cyclohydrolase|nr:bifunctional methylenetetrahydrofolate dehydrogenase/methenyltetrahydrofolate cyclohydrolase FolD [Thermoleophilaceae bacterium]
MSARIIDGKAVAAQVRERVRAEVADMDPKPGLATILVGDDPASHVYVRNKHKASEEVGIRSIHHGLEASVPEEELADLITRLGEDDSVSGILLQLPVPGHIDPDAMIELIDPLKDVDGLTTTNAGLLVQGREGLVSCTPAGVMELLDSEGVELRGAEAVVVGRSQLVGRPLASLLLARDATVTMCHSRTRNLAEVCSRADVLVAAVGRPHLVTAEMVGEGAVVIDVGINRTDDGLVGDVDFDAVVEKAAAITPVPGGVGPMTIAMLLVNTVKAARLQTGERGPALR